MRFSPSSVKELLKPVDRDSVLVGGTKLKLPTPIDPNLSEHRKNLILLAAVSTLESQPRLSFLHKYQALGKVSQYSVLTDSLIQDVDELIEDQFCTPANFVFKSFHTEDGQPSPSSATTAVAQILKPFGDPNNPTQAVDRADDHLRFVQVTVQLNLDDLTEGDKQNRLREKSYIILPQTRVVVQDDAGQPMSLETYVGPRDIFSMSKDEFISKIASQIG